MPQPNGNAGVPRGFAGLAELMSDGEGEAREIARSAASAAKAAAPGPTGGSGSSTFWTRLVRSAGVFIAPRHRSTTLTVVGIAAVLILFFVAAHRNVPAPMTADPAPQVANIREITPPPETTDPTAESLPPVGTDLVLNREQIRYCTSESIRLDSSRLALTNPSEVEVTSFNGAVADFNRRCASFRYHGGMVDVEKSAAEQRRAELERQGRDRAQRWHNEAAAARKSRQRAKSIPSASEAPVEVPPRDQGVGFRTPESPRRDVMARASYGAQHRSPGREPPSLLRTVGES